MGLQKTNRTYHLKFRVKSPWVVGADSCSYEVVVDRVMNSCEGGGWLSAGRESVATRRAPHLRCPGATGPTFCLVCLVGGPSLLPTRPSQSAGFLSEGILACLLAFLLWEEHIPLNSPVPHFPVQALPPTPTPGSHVTSKGHLGASASPRWQ